MANVRNQAKYDEARSQLIDIGMSLIRSRSFASVGISDILKEADIPKGSFYHYFSTKEDYGLAIAESYHDQQLRETRTLLNDSQKAPIDKLFNFFENASLEYQRREFADGCLMCNLSVELGDQNERFQQILKRQWHELTAELQQCLSELDNNDIGLAHLSDAEAAQWLINSWSGALVRMKADGNATPLTLFMKTVFKEKGELTL
ncbi:TetR/AcrR family transcriptional regulator [Alteromonadaceae bacterium M269]|nr:TetR/AcrR family transcriptional regulator [Alteromonadaceae bacterium M269]